MTFEEWWLKESTTIADSYQHRCSSDSGLCPLEGLAASLRHFMEIAWLEGYAQGQMDSQPSEVP